MKRNLRKPTREYIDMSPYGERKRLQQKNSDGVSRFKISNILIGIDFYWCLHPKWYLDNFQWSVTFKRSTNMTFLCCETALTSGQLESQDVLRYFWFIECKVLLQSLILCIESIGFEFDKKTLKTFQKQNLKMSPFAYCHRISPFLTAFRLPKSTPGTLRRRRGWTNDRLRPVHDGPLAFETQKPVGRDATRSFPFAHLRYAK